MLVQKRFIKSSVLLLCLLTGTSTLAQTPSQSKQNSATNETKASPVAAQNTNTPKPNAIYKVVAADGSVTYTDRPSADAKPVAFDGKTQNVVTASPPPVIRPLVKVKQPSYTVSILSPAPEATVRNNLGEVTIQATQPRAPKAPVYRLIFNDAPYASNASGVFRLKGIHRGAHTFKVELTNNTGKTLASSPLQTLYLHQASALINN